MTAALNTAVDAPPTEAELIARGIDLTRAIAHRHGRDWHEREEFAAAGALAVMRTIRTREFRCLPRFESYIHLAMRAVVSKWRLWGRRRPTARLTRPLYTLGTLQHDDEVPYPELVIDPCPDTAERTAERNETIAVVRRAVSALPDWERRLLERHHYDGLTFRELTGEFGLTAGPLCVRLRAVLEGLKQRLIEEGCGGVP